MASRGPTLRSWLGPATERMLDLAGVTSGGRVLDVAAGAGDQTLQAAARVAPGQPGPFSLGTDGALDDAFTRAGFRDVKVETIAAPLRMKSSAECLRFEQESFGALRQMLSSLEPAGREAAWSEVGSALAAFDDGQAGFVAPCELVIGVGTKGDLR